MRAKRLGRGLSNLINKTDEETPPAVKRRTAPPPADRDVPVEGVDPAATTAAATEAPSEAPLGKVLPPVPAAPRAPGDGVHTIPPQNVRSNPFQPRTTFRDEALDELCASIQEHGVLQPIVVRRAAAGGYELIAGERRLRAVQRLALAAVPAVIRPATDEEMQTLALVENLQREDLNAMEKSRALRAMMQNFALTQENVALRVGKARTTVANLLRLLDLPVEVQAFVEEGKLSGAHARAVLQAEGTARRLDLARVAVAKALSVREVERLARQGPTVGKRRTARKEDPYVRDLEKRLQQALSTEVRLKARGKGGRIEVRYHDADELDRLLEAMGA